MPIPTTPKPRIRATGKTEVSLVQKAGKPAQMAVYAADGTLVGLIDPKDLQTLVQADDDGKAAEAAQVAAQSAKVAAQHDPATPDSIVAAVTKTTASVLETMPRRTAGELVSLRKAAVTAERQWSQLLEAAGPSRSIALKTAVANVALKAMIAGAGNSTRTVNIAKKAVLTAALTKKVI